MEKASPSQAHLALPVLSARLSSDLCSATGLQVVPPIIVYSLSSSSSPERGRQWQHRLTALSFGAVSVIHDPRTLSEVLGEPKQQPAASRAPVVLLDCGMSLAAVVSNHTRFDPTEPVAEVQALPAAVAALLRLHPAVTAVAVVPALTWAEASPWLLSGVRGVVAWQSQDEDVCALLEAAHHGLLPQLHAVLLKTLRADEVSASEARRRQDHTAPTQSGCQTPQVLSKREREVLPLLCQGLSNGEIAHRLFVTEDDIRHHLKNLYRKLGTSNRIRVLLLALSNNWVALPEILEKLGFSKLSMLFLLAVFQAADALPEALPWLA